MKYTRYDYKKKNNDKIIFLCIFIGIILASVFIATGISNLLIKTSLNKTSTAASSVVSSESKSKYQIAVIQSGVFSSRENAEARKIKLKEYVTPFIIEEDGKFKVFAGVFEVSSADNMVNMLNEKGIERYKAVYEIQYNNQGYVDLSQLIDGHIKVLSKLNENGVNSIVTDEFKKWADGVKTEGLNADIAKSVESYKAYIKALPAELSKDKIEENYIFIYNCIKQEAVKK